MRTTLNHTGRLAVALLFSLMTVAAAHAQAVVAGISGNDPGSPTFNLVTGTANLPTPDGDSMHVWLYGDGSNPVQYPGPTLIVNAGDTVTVNLTNNLSTATSIIFPGQGLVSLPAGGDAGDAGMLTREAAAGGGAVSYEFEATEPGTYMYYSGTATDLQVEMGLLGAIIVRPAGFDQVSNRTAYGTLDTAYEHEYLFLWTEMDANIHDLVENGFSEYVDSATYFPVFWFINGRNGFDTIFPDSIPWQPNQPYGSLARAHPGEKVLIRMVSGGRDIHPFHPHGDHALQVARDGRLISSDGLSADLGTFDFTFSPHPGSTLDAIWDWTSKGLGWDIYGDPAEAGFEHACVGAGSDNIDPATGEDCNSHGVRVDSKVTLPGLQDVTPGGFWSGSPFLGQFGELPPGEGGLNIYGGQFFMWHSHSEKELINFDVFPGGMLTAIIVEPPGVPIP